MPARKVFIAAEIARLMASHLAMVQRTFYPISEANPFLLFKKPERLVGWLQFMPHGMIVAYSLELYLKSLKAIESKFYEGGHDLKQLFDALCPKTKSLVKAEYDRMATTDSLTQMRIQDDPKEDRSFDTRLKRSRSAFDESRYLFEKRRTPKKGGWSANLITEAVRNTIIQKRPSWTKYASEALRYCAPKYQFHQTQGPYLSLAVSHAIETRLPILRPELFSDPKSTTPSK